MCGAGHCRFDGCGFCGCFVGLLADGYVRWNCGVGCWCRGCFRVGLDRFGARMVSWFLGFGSVGFWIWSFELWVVW